jgi:hypothetical protein
MVIWYIFSHFGMSQHEKSGNPAKKPRDNCHGQRNTFLHAAIYLLPFADFFFFG